VIDVTIRGVVGGTQKSKGVSEDVRSTTNSMVWITENRMRKGIGADAQLDSWCQDIPAGCMTRHHYKARPTEGGGQLN
jgi:hypothetical protein